jgi:hypothetical protein
MPTSLFHRRLPLLMLCALGLATVWARAVTPSPAAAGVSTATLPPLPPAVTIDPTLLTKPPAVVDGYLKLDFDRLADYKFDPVPFDPDKAKPGDKPPSSADQIPAAIKKYDGQKALVTGYMLATRLKEGKVVEFLLQRAPSMCCYGIVPPMNEWVTVKMPGGAKLNEDTPVSFTGTFHVHEDIEGGYLLNIYTLDGAKLIEAKK